MSGKDFFDTVLFQGGHSVADGLFPNLLHLSPVLNKLFHRIGANQQLMYTHSPPVTRVVADVAAYWFEKGHVLRIGRIAISLIVFLIILPNQFGKFILARIVLFLAIGAERSDQSLGQDAQDGIGKVEWIHSHVEQTGNTLRSAVGVQGGKYKMACERCLDTDVGGLFITHLTDHDHIRVSPEKRAHGRRKIEPDLGFHLDLAQAFLRDFDGIFSSPNFGFGFVDIGES